MRLSHLLLTFLFLCIPAQSGWAAKETVALPLSIDYPLLRSLVVAQAFTEPGESRVILNEHNGCTRIVLSKPQYRPAGQQLYLDVTLSARAGQAIGDTCIPVAAWEGHLSFLQSVRVSSNWQLTFPIIDSALTNLYKQQKPMTDFLWNLVKVPIHRYLNQISISLMPPVTDLKGFLFPLFPGGSDAGTNAMLDTLRCNQATVTPDGLRFDLLLDVESSQELAQEAMSTTLSQEELTRIIDSWEAWDGFVVQIIAMLAKEPLQDEERQILLDALLDIRYRFIEGLAANKMNSDFVREQFVDTWRQLSPVFRNHLGLNPSHNILGYLSFFTATDALIAMDKIGPSLGLEISKDGLLRLLHMLGAQPQISGGTAVNQPLRQSLGLPPQPRAGSLPPDSSVVPEEIIIEPSPEPLPGAMPPPPVDGPVPPESASPAVPGPLETGRPAPPTPPTAPGTIMEEIIPAAPVNPTVPVAPPPVPVGPGTETPEAGPDGISEETIPADPSAPSPAEMLPAPGEPRIDDTVPSPPPASYSAPAGETGSPLLQQQDIDAVFEEREKPAAPAQSPPLSWLRSFFLSPACAAEPPAFKPDPQEIKGWLVTRQNLQPHVNRVKNILDSAAVEIMVQGKKLQKPDSFYRDLVTATAWQESCFHHFVVSKDKVTFLKSSNGSAVGLMQVNERVWKGLYDLNRLRWDVRYNAQAGTEILDLYYQKYALKKKDCNTLAASQLAGIIYAMYNGGPGEMDRYLKRVQKNELNVSDRLFLEKFSWVQDKSWHHFNKCVAD